jgi:hypothetical protein
VTPVDTVQGRRIKSVSHQLDVLLLDGECPGPDAAHLFQSLVQGKQIVRLAMCERSPLGLSHAQNRMSGRPQVALQSPGQTPCSVGQTPGEWCWRVEKALQERPCTLLLVESTTFPRGAQNRRRG